jgi:hypothetical protein
MANVRTEPEPVEAWRRAWRDGICPQLTDRGLEALRIALEKDDQKLCIGTTMKPLPLYCNRDETIEACCPLCFALLDGQKPSDWMTGELEDRFATACYNAERLMGYPGAAKEFLNWVDSVPRLEMRAKLLLEAVMELALRQRGKKSRVCPSCGSINITGAVPTGDDEDGWRGLAMDHERFCNWIRTRAGQYQPPSEIYYKPTPLAKLLEASIAAVKAGDQPKPAA